MRSELFYILTAGLKMRRTGCCCRFIPEMRRVKQYTLRSPSFLSRLKAFYLSHSPHIHTLRCSQQPASQHQCALCSTATTEKSEMLSAGGAYNNMMHARDVCSQHQHLCTPCAAVRGHSKEHTLIFAGLRKAFHKKMYFCMQLHAALCMHLCGELVIFFIKCCMNSI